MFVTVGPTVEHCCNLSWKKEGRRLSRPPCKVSQRGSRGHPGYVISADSYQPETHLCQILKVSLKMFAKKKPYQISRLIVRTNFCSYTAWTCRWLTVAGWSPLRHWSHCCQKWTKSDLALAMDWHSKENLLHIGRFPFWENSRQMTSSHIWAVKDE